MALWSGFFAPSARMTLNSRPSLMLFFLLVGAYLLTLVPHIVSFPLWISTGIVGAMVVRGGLEIYRLPLPSHAFCAFLALVLAVSVFLQFGTLAGREAGTAFTAALLAVKFFELRRDRDVALIIFSCFFLVMSILLYSQVLELFVYCLIMMWLLTALLLRVHMGDSSQDRLLRMLERAGLIFLQALPLAFVLFFFFPRYHGSLSLALNDPTIGLTDTVAPGSIAKLSQDDSEAMYVKFESGSIPLPESMYWRALVLWDYRAGVWTRGAAPERDARNQPESPPDRTGTVLQEITMRPHNQRWLFALDAPVTRPINSAEPTYWGMLLENHTVRLTQATAKVDHKVRYTIYSTMNPVTEELDARMQSRALDYGSVDPQVVALASELHRGISDDHAMDYVYAVIRYFRHNHFVYTTEPGPQAADWLSHFLFRSRKGFCEHYASAFAVLMRLQGVPARMVAGYLGGDYNPYDNKYTVYQSNAHAWDEVWIADKNQPAGGIRGHWMRIDPTALITSLEEPGLTGAARNLGRTEAVRKAIQATGFVDAYLPEWAKNDLKEVKLRREEIETNWDNMVLSYNPETQEKLAQKLGFSESGGFSFMLLACLATGGICLYVFRRWTKPKTVRTPMENLYAIFCLNMAQRGVPRAAWEGPLAYTKRVAEVFPYDRSILERVGAIVATARYGPAPMDSSAPENLQSLLTLLTASQAAAKSRE